LLQPRLTNPASNAAAATSSPTTSELRAHMTQLTRLIRLAQLCSHERLLNTMVDLLKQVMVQNKQFAYLAMSLADELDLRVLKGSAYLEVMQKGVVVRRGNGASSNEVEGELDPSGRLIVNPTQQFRLLSGYYRLTSTWESLRSVPPLFEHSPACAATWHQHGCTQSWLEFWKEKTRSEGVLSLGLADVLGRLRVIQKEFDRWGSATYMHHDCRVAARRCILEKIDAVQDELPDFFSCEFE